MRQTLRGRKGWAPVNFGADLLVREERRFLDREFVVRPAGSGLFLGAEEGQGGQAAVRSGGQEVRELGERGHRGDVVQDKRHWWVEATGR